MLTAKYRKARCITYLGIVHDRLGHDRGDLELLFGGHFENRLASVLATVKVLALLVGVGSVKVGERLEL